MQVTISRGVNMDYLVKADGVVVGRAWRWRKRADGTRATGFGVAIDGVYWRANNPSRSGSPTTGVRLLRDASDVARTALDFLGARDIVPPV